MIKKAISAFSAVIMLFSMLPLIALNASAAKNYHKDDDIDSRYSMLWDDAGIFSEENYEFLNDNIQQYADELEMNICVYVSGTVRSDYSTEIFADDTYDEMYDEDTDGIFYYLDISGKRPAYDYISTSGKAVLMYQKHVDDIFSFLDSYLPSSGETVYEDDIYNAVNGFLSILYTYAGDFEPNFLNYYHDKSSGKYFYYKDDELMITKSKPPALWLLTGAASAVIGLVIAVICWFTTKSSYKFKSTTNPGVYVARNETFYTQKSDMLIRTYVTKTKIESSSGGGHGGGGHSHSGGHGGGGHHR